MQKSREDISAAYTISDLALEPHPALRWQITSKSAGAERLEPQATETRSSNTSNAALSPTHREDVVVAGSPIPKGWNEASRPFSG